MIPRRTHIIAKNESDLTFLNNESSIEDKKFMKRNKELLKNWYRIKNKFKLSVDKDDLRLPL
jgi:hypothetical protein